MFENPTLDCQGCGTTLRELTRAEAAKVADRPYDYIAFCRMCARDQEVLRWPG